MNPDNFDDDPFGSGGFEEWDDDPFGADDDGAPGYVPPPVAGYVPPPAAAYVPPPTTAASKINAIISRREAAEREEEARQERLENKTLAGIIQAGEDRPYNQAYSDELRDELNDVANLSIYHTYKRRLLPSIVRNVPYYGVVNRNQELFYDVVNEGVPGAYAQHARRTTIQNAMRETPGIDRLGGDVMGLIKDYTGEFPKKKKKKKKNN